MPASTRITHRQTTPDTSDLAQNGDTHNKGKEASPASTESSQDDGDNNRERPVRRKLKKASIAGIDSHAHDAVLTKLDNENAEGSATEDGVTHTGNISTTGKETRGRVRRKRSFEDTGEEDSQESSLRNASKHIRKRSREVSESREGPQSIGEEPLTQGSDAKELLEDTSKDLEGKASTSNVDESSVTNEAPDSNSVAVDTIDVPITASTTIPSPSTPQPLPPTDDQGSAERPTSPGVKRSLNDLAETENNNTNDAEVEVADLSEEKSETDSNEATEEPQTKRHQDSVTSEKEQTADTVGTEVERPYQYVNKCTNLVNRFQPQADLPIRPHCPPLRH